MKTLKRASIVLAAVLLVGVGWIALRQLAPRRTPAGQPPLEYVNQTSDLESLRAKFNAASDRTRVIALLSPT